ncbi:hypothetical protein CULCOIPH003_18730 [Corynebacterium ulcerans]|uniref:Transposase n=1 Tax=Corynebacterium ulcerans TaxID=65058 RepID=A0ABD0BFK9_CORUL|nr:hypothetical protein AFK72_03255 [Corynebacterium ulcerans]GJJ39242.1 hypothetical protein CULCOIPH003_18730 [Corynebacterium ulcerans]GJJ42578.1 hypothetical protein CULCOIPH005_07670 [Corynebacterium ulcerans]
MAAMKITIQLKVFSAPIKTVKTRKYGSLQDHDKTSLQSTQPPPFEPYNGKPLTDLPVGGERTVRGLMTSNENQ